MSRAAPRRFAALPFLAVVLAACYDYRAVTPGPQPAAMPIRVALAAGGTTRVEPAFGPFIVGLEGTLEGPWPADSLRLRVFATKHQTGFRSDLTGVPLTLPASDVQLVERRLLNRMKTGMLSAAIGVVLIAMPAVIQNAGGGGGSSTGSGPVQP